MKGIIGISWMLFIGILYTTCSSQSVSTKREHDYSSLEHHLMRKVQIKGESVQLYHIKDRMAYHDIPGVSVAVVKEGELKYSKAYGYRDADSKLPMTTETLIQVASVSKPITALGILKLVDKGIIDLDANVNQYLKRWHIPNNRFTDLAEVTTRHLLTHTSGLNSHGFDGYHRDDQMPSPIDVLNGNNDDGPVRVHKKPGSSWRYSGGGYVVLQLLIEDVTGVSFEQYMNEEILKPLKMTNSVYQMPLDTSKYSNVSSGHYNDGTVLNGQWRNLVETGAGGLWSTVGDIAKYCIAIQDIYSGKKVDFISKQTIDLMLTKHSSREWGLGPSITSVGESTIFRHDGKNHGYFAEFIAYADKGEAVVIATNADKGPNLSNELMLGASALFGWDVVKPREIEVPVISLSELEQYIGVYDWVDRPGFHIQVELRDQQLIANGSGFPTDYLRPTGEHSFIDLDSGVEIIFKKADGSISGMNWRNFEFTKLD